MSYFVKITNMDYNKENNIKKSVKKPSELCQVLYYDDYNSKKLSNMSNLQIDIIEAMYVIVSSSFMSVQMNKSEIYDQINYNSFDLDISYLSKTINKYKKSNYNVLITELKKIQKTQILINVLSKNKSKKLLLFKLIRKIEHKTSNTISVWFEPEIISMYFNVKNLYTTVYVPILTSLKSKYTKLLYLLLLDYCGIGNKSIEYKILMMLLNIDIHEKPRLNNWAIFNRDILKPKIKEINNITNLNITYNVVKKRDNIADITEYNIRFKMKIQPMSNDVSSDVSDKTIDLSEQNPNTISRYDKKLNDIAEKQMQDAIVFGTTIIKPQAYKRKIIQNLLEDNIDIDSILELEDIVNDIKNQFSEFKNAAHQVIVLLDYDGELIVSISNDYLLYSPISKKTITKTVKETIERINNLEQNNKGFSLHETTTRITELEFSYL